MERQQQLQRYRPIQMDSLSPGVMPLLRVHWVQPLLYLKRTMCSPLPLVQMRLMPENLVSRLVLLTEQLVLSVRLVPLH